MGTYVSGFMNDLYAVKYNVNLRLRICHTWMQPVFGKPRVNNLELILMDEQACIYVFFLFNLDVKKCLPTLNLSDLFLEQDTRIQGQARVALINKFEHQLEEGKYVTLQGYSLGEIQPKYNIVKKGQRLSFLSTTTVQPCPDFT